MFKKRRKKEKEPIEEPEDELPEAPEPEEDMSEHNEKIEELNAEIKALKNKKTKGKIGSFSLDESEMALAVNALASSEEFKLYQQMVIGQRVAEIIEAYNKVVKGESEDTDELPTE